jgi:hypothetical protein
MIDSCAVMSECISVEENVWDNPTVMSPQKTASSNDFGGLCRFGRALIPIASAISPVSPHIRNSGFNSIHNGLLHDFRILVVMN